MLRDRGIYEIKNKTRGMRKIHDYVIIERVLTRVCAPLPTPAR